MKGLRDPEGAEVSRLLAACPFPGKRVLEIGCGSGKLTWLYADQPRQVVGIDPAACELRQAKADRPPSIPNGGLLQAMAEALPFLSHTFDIALFASSL
jgi:ubiquinone/menaquinone biosynthesis C-methylase UbiE